MKKSNFTVRCVNRLFVLLPMSRMHPLKSSLLRWAGLKVGKNVRIWSSARFYSPHIEIGDDSFIGFNVQLFGTREGPITIGRNCALGTDVIVNTGTHHPGGPLDRTGAGYAKAITIGDGCRISTRAIILEGAQIGRGAQIAAGAVVVRDVAEDTLVGGVPARFIKQLDRMAA